MPKLTKRAIDALKPEAKDFFVWDSQIAGFGVSARHAPTVEELVERYIDEHLPKLPASSAKDQASMLKTLVLSEWRTRKVTDITPTDVDRLLTKIAAGRPRV